MCAGQNTSFWRVKFVRRAMRELKKIVEREIEIL
jgi:hypothetical protein